jgi:hypothetical protein
MSDIQKETVGAILQETVAFLVHVNRKGILHKLGILPKTRKFTISPAVLATMLKISRELLSVKLGDGFDINKGDTIPVVSQAITDNTDILVRVIALAIENGGKEPRKGLEKFLKRNLSAAEMFQLLSLVIKKIDIMGFMSSIIAIKGVSLLNPEEKTASGEQSED